MTKKKKLAASIAAGCAASVLLIGSALAFLTSNTETKTNNFTFGSSSNGSIAASLTEPSWDCITSYTVNNGKIVPVFGKTSDNKPIYGYTNGSRNQPITDINDSNVGTRPLTTATGAKLGIDTATDLLPGMTVNKDPIVTNTSTHTDIWTALKLTFVYGGGDKAGQPLNDTDMKAVQDVISINYDTINWTASEKNSSNSSFVYAYNKVLSKEQSSTPLFTTVTVKSSATTEQMNKVTSMGNFSIFIEGMAEQNSGAANITEFSNSALSFANTPTASAPADLSAKTSGKSAVNS